MTTLRNLLRQKRELEARLDKGLDYLIAHEDDPNYVKWLEGWHNLVAQHTNLYSDILLAWRESGARLTFDFPADAPIGVVKDHWRRLEDGTLQASYAYAEWQLIAGPLEEEEWAIPELA